MITDFEDIHEPLDERHEVENPAAIEHLQRVLQRSDGEVQWRAARVFDRKGAVEAQPINEEPNKAHSWGESDSFVIQLSVMISPSNVGHPVMVDLSNDARQERRQARRAQLQDQIKRAKSEVKALEEKLAEVEG